MSGVGSGKDHSPDYPPVTADAPYACLVCGGGVKVLARDLPGCAEATGGYMHFGCMVLADARGGGS